MARGLKKKPSADRTEEEIQKLKERYDLISTVENPAKKFVDLPLSNKTIKGLHNAKFFHPTDIQRETINVALKGKDILAAAVTGSGKTLAFLIPVLEHLFVTKWSRMNGVCAIILSPTRELAYQIFETLKKVGCYHDFSAGLIIGGKNLKFERTRMDQCNILICTPGRLLQHMDENPFFNASTMEVLVLDEADRCLDMGFEQTLNAIIENFPPSRQTLLFSATQTSSIKDLARLNLHDPVCIGLSDENGPLSVPAYLQQNYIVVPLEEKITVLWSFIKNHSKQKIIVFLSSCKQVKYIYEIFCKLRPGTSLLALYGTLHQDRRIAIYNDFIRKSNVVLFATDIASRGLDFPGVNWVVQLDCPEDVNQYIHRAGRSARNHAHGESLLVLMPSEEEFMIKALNQKFIQLNNITIDPKKLFSPRAKIESLLVQNSELKASAQRAFLSYIKSVYLMKNKTIFNVKEINFDGFAKSLGLVNTPRIRFLERVPKKKKISAHFQNTFTFTGTDTGSDSDSGDLLKIKRADHELHKNNDGEKDLFLEVPKREKLVTKAALAKKAIRKKVQVNKKLQYDNDGCIVVDSRKSMQSKLAQKLLVENKDGGIDIELSKQLLTEEDKYDKQRFRDLIKQRHKKFKTKLNKQDAVEMSDGSDTERSLDLNWLPDPDVVYNRSKTKASNVQNDAASYNESCQLAKRFKVSDNLSLGDAELIASQLLSDLTKH